MLQAAIEPAYTQIVIRDMSVLIAWELNKQLFASISKKSSKKPPAHNKNMGDASQRMGQEIFPINSQNNLSHYGMEHGPWSVVKGPL